MPGTTKHSRTHYTSKRYSIVLHSTAKVPRLSASFKFTGPLFSARSSESDLERLFSRQNGEEEIDRRRRRCRGGTNERGPASGERRFESIRLIPSVVDESSCWDRNVSELSLQCG